MIYKSPRNQYSHLTVKKRKWPSFPTKQLWKRGLIQGRVLDFGCGLGADVLFLNKNGIDAVGYDPHYAPDYPKEKFDTILCHYVLNVLFTEEQSHVLMAVSELLKPSGRAYFTVRRDVKRGGFRLHTKHAQKVYQCNVVLPYKSILLENHCEIYEYQPINSNRAEAIEDCLYCVPSAEYELVTESATAYTLLMSHKNQDIHIAIIPKRHETEFFNLSQHEKTACWIMADRVQSVLNKRFQPTGYRLEIEKDKSMLQRFPHAHINLQLKDCGPNR